MKFERILLVGATIAALSLMPRAVVAEATFIPVQMTSGDSYALSSDHDLSVSQFANLPAEKALMLVVIHYRAGMEFYRKRAEAAVSRGDKNDALVNLWRSDTIHNYFILPYVDEQGTKSGPRAWKGLLERMQKASPDQKLRTIIQAAFNQAFSDAIDQMK